MKSQAKPRSALQGTIQPILLTSIIYLAVACSGSSSPNTVEQNAGNVSTTTSAPALASEFEFIDPNSAANNRFGITVVELANGNIAVRSMDSSVATENGAVHIYNPNEESIVASFYGDLQQDYLGSGALRPLSNGNLVIVSHWDNTGSINSGSVMLVNGETGEQIGSTIDGPNFVDFIGGQGITELVNGNFVIASGSTNLNGDNLAGSIRLVDGSSGAQIGSTLYGESASAEFGVGDNSIAPLANGNFAVTAKGTMVNGLNSAGKVYLVDGTTAAIVGTPVSGNAVNDRIGRTGVFALSNGNYVIASPTDNIGSNFSVGSAMLVNGTTGALIQTITGTNGSDQYASNGILELNNNEFLISSPYFNGSNLGSVNFFNADTGLSTASAITGATSGELLGLTNPIFQMANGNIVVSSISYDFSDFATGTFITDLGRVVLIDGSTKTVIASIEGTDPNGKLGSSGVKDLGNGNFAVVSELHDNGGMPNVGAIMVFNGTTGAQVGSTIFGDDATDQLGIGGITVLENGNFAVSSPLDIVNGMSQAGSVMLINGSTGALIATITGDDQGDQMSLDGITALKDSSNFVISSSEDDINGIVNAGSFTLVNGSTGSIIGTPETGDDTDDFYGKIGVLGNNYHLQFDLTGVTALSSGNYVISAQFDDINGEADTGFVKYKLGQ